MMDVFLDVDHKDQMEGEEREAIAKMVSDLICTREMGISDLETRKWIVMIILSEKRRKAGHFVSFSEEQAQLLDQFRPLFPLDEMCIRDRPCSGRNSGTGGESRRQRIEQRS